MTDIQVPDHNAQRTAFRNFRQGSAAVALRLAGASFAEVAEALGLADVGAARIMIESTLANGVTSQDREQLRELEAARLDRLQRSVWAKATDADHPEHLQAVKVAQSLGESRRKLLGLDAPAEVTVRTPTQDELDRWVAEVTASTVGPLALLEASVVDVEITAE